MKPWSLNRRSQMVNKINKEAARAAARLGARTVSIIATFEDGEYVHILEGGKYPFATPKETYERMVLMHKMMEQSGGEDVDLTQTMGSS